MTEVLIAHPTDPLILAGQSADRAASEHVFQDYQQRSAVQTLRRQRADLRRFATYLASARIIPGADLAETEAAAYIHAYAERLATVPAAWSSMTWGLIAGFQRWALLEGDASGSINVRLATLKRYAELAYQAGALSTDAFALIRTVKGYGRKHQRKVDEKRIQTRQTNTKKAAAIIVAPKYARALKTQPDTPQGRRDAVLMCLLLDHGLRCGEVAGLLVSNVDLNAETLTFYRQKVSMDTTHRLTPDTRRALKAYLADVTMLPDDPLLLGSTKGGNLRRVDRSTDKITGGMSERAINARVRSLARRLGVSELADLSPHDCRHTAATYYARSGVPLDKLQAWGGWSSLAMPMQYIERSKIANEGMEGIELYAESND
jgi:integrase